MTQDQTPDPNILRCALKKTASVVSRHILFASKAVVATTAIILAGAGAIYGTAAIWSVIGTPLTALVTATISALFAIPWYYYALAAIPVAYFGYSLVWCMARNITEDDWKSVDIEKTLALAAFTALAFAALAVIALAPADFTALALAALVALALAALALAALAVIALASAALAFAALAFVALAALASDSNYGSPAYFVIRFIGAYRHSRKRLLAEKNTRGKS